VRNLDLGIRRGEVFGLLGPNGAGKTSAIHMMIGFLEPTAGASG
jgi:ABC-2 type transport system ATP-binding protein